MTASMPLVDALTALRAVRTDQVVVTSMGTAREWMTLGEHPLDFVHVPSSMGQSASLGLGLALARPERTIVVCTGDGSLLMNLGALVSITAEAPPNLVLLAFDNGAYEVTGGQATAGASAGRRAGDAIDLAEIARACGFRAVFAFDDLEQWRSQAASVLGTRGPVFGHLRVAPIPGAVGPRSPGPAAARAKAFREALVGQDEVRRQPRVSRRR